MIAEGRALRPLRPVPEALAISWRKKELNEIVQHAWLRRTGHLAHQGKQVLLGIAKEGHPEIVIRHAGQEMGFIFEMDAGSEQLAVGRFDVRDGKIQNRAGVVKFRLLGRREHEAYTAAIEEGELASSE